jgi:hypothetical protein
MPQTAEQHVTFPLAQEAYFSCLLASFPTTISQMWVEATMNILKILS